jgi:hypothetical protein
MIAAMSLPGLDDVAAVLGVVALPSRIRRGSRLRDRGV